MHLLILVLAASASLFNNIDANFQCKKQSNNNGNNGNLQNPSSIPALQNILNLSPVASLEGICLNVCHKCSGRQAGGSNQGQGHSGSGSGGNGGILGLGGVLGLLRKKRDLVGDLLSGTPAQCLANNGVPLSPYQACIFPCILELNVLNTCDVTAIISKLINLCPTNDIKNLCASVCLCCGDNSTNSGSQPLDACLNLCLSHSGGNQGGGLPGGLLPGGQGQSGNNGGSGGQVSAQSPSGQSQATTSAQGSGGQQTTVAAGGAEASAGASAQSQAQSGQANNQTEGNNAGASASAGSEAQAQAGQVTSTQGQSNPTTAASSG